VPHNLAQIKQLTKRPFYRDNDSLG
jgi:hypothetical protein